MSTNSKLSRVADNIRILSAAMVEKSKSGHPGGAMGIGKDFFLGRKKSTKKNL